MLKNRLTTLYTFPTILLLTLVVSGLTYGICEELKSTENLLAPEYPKAVEEKSVEKTRQYADPHYSKNSRASWPEEKKVFHTKESLSTVIKYYESKLGKKFTKDGNTYYMVLHSEVVTCGEYADRVEFSIRIHTPGIEGEENFYLLTDEKDGEEYLPQDQVIEKNYKEKSKNGQKAIEAKMKKLQDRAKAGDRKAAMEMGQSGKDLMNMGAKLQEEKKTELQNAAFHVRIVIDHEQNKTAGKKNKKKSTPLKDAGKKGKDVTDKLKNLF